MRIETEVKLDFKDVLIRPKRSTLNSRRDVDIEREFKMKHSGLTWSGVPIIAANMDHTGTFEMAKALAKFNVLTAIHKFYSVQEWKDFADKNPEVLERVFVSSGTSDKDFERVSEILKVADCPNICIDIANGYSQHLVDYVRRVRAAYPHKVIMAGNVVTGEMVEELIICGADIVKVGIGPGSVCTTRRQTGCGYPQLSAIIECADAAHGLKGLVCGDGGCTVPGDVAKAFAAGSDFVMLGGMLSGHDESSGDVFEHEGRQVKRYYGMSSEEAMKKHMGGVASYRSSEGKSVNVPYKGAVEGTMQDILGGVRSTCTYVGAERLKELTKRTTFICVTQQINDIFTPYNAG